MNIPQMTKIIETDIISIVSPVSGVESDNGTSSSKSVVVFLLVVEAFRCFIIEPLMAKATRFLGTPFS